MSLRLLSFSSVAKKSDGRNSLPSSPKDAIHVQETPKKPSESCLTNADSLVVEGGQYEDQFSSLPWQCTLMLLGEWSMAQRRVQQILAMFKFWT